MVKNKQLNKKEEDSELLLKNLTVILFCLIGTFSLISTFTNVSYAQVSSLINTAGIPNNFNIAIASDWGCKGDAENTAKNIQSHNPELVIAGGDLSYKGTATCWSYNRTVQG